jgi:hypothetical protein
MKKTEIYVACELVIKKTSFYNTGFSEANAVLMQKLLRQWGTSFLGRGTLLLSKLRGCPLLTWWWGHLTRA